MQPLLSCRRMRRNSCPLQDRFHFPIRRPAPQIPCRQIRCTRGPARFSANPSRRRFPAFCLRAAKPDKPDCRCCTEPVCRYTHYSPVLPQIRSTRRWMHHTRCKTSWYGRRPPWMRHRRATSARGFRFPASRSAVSHSTPRCHSPRLLRERLPPDAARL